MTLLNIAMFDELQILLSARNSDDRILDVCLLLVQHLAKEKKCKDHYNQYRSVILARISEHFTGKNAKNPERNREFVRRTLPGFVTVIATTLSKFGHVTEDQASSLRSIFKAYLKDSVRF